MDYQKAIEYIESLALWEQKRPAAPSLQRIEAFLSFYNSPQNSFRAFHIGGTNGKGSTVSMLDSIMRLSHLKIGRFTGPHLLRFNERFHIDGQPIADNDFSYRVACLRAQSESFAVLNPQMGRISWFEFITILAFIYFAENNVDIAIIEVGLGGRFDATNVLHRLCATGITNVALDHEHILGSNIATIAIEKAGIIKSGVPIITTATEPALSIIAARAQEINAPLIICSQTNDIDNAQHSQIEQSLYSIKRDLNCRGIYQYQNALLALNMVEHSGFVGPQSQTNQIDISDALQAVRTFYWPGRFQILEREQIILDCAHNPAGMNSLRASLDHSFPEQSFHFIFACYNDKDGINMLNHLLKAGDSLYLIDLPGKRPSFSQAPLAEYAHEHNVAVTSHQSLSKALADARAKRKSDEFIVVTGSFATVKALMQLLGWQTVEDGID